MDSIRDFLEYAHLREFGFLGLQGQSIDKSRNYITQKQAKKVFKRRVDSEARTRSPRSTLLCFLEYIRDEVNLHYVLKKVIKAKKQKDKHFPYVLLSVLRRMIFKCWKNPWSYIVFSDICLRIGWTKRALQCLQEATTRYASSAVFRVAVASCLFNAGDIRTSQKYLLRLLTGSDSTNIYFYLAALIRIQSGYLRRIYNSTGQFDNNKSDNTEFLIKIINKLNGINARARISNEFKLQPGLPIPSLLKRTELAPNEILGNCIVLSETQTAVLHDLVLLTIHDTLLSLSIHTTLLETETLSCTPEDVLKNGKTWVSLYFSARYQLTTSPNIPTLLNIIDTASNRIDGVIAIFAIFIWIMQPSGCSTHDAVTKTAGNTFKKKGTCLLFHMNCMQMESEDQQRDPVKHANYPSGLKRRRVLVNEILLRKESFAALAFFSREIAIHFQECDALSKSFLQLTYEILVSDSNLEQETQAIAALRNMPIEYIINKLEELNCHCEVLHEVKCLLELSGLTNLNGIQKSSKTAFKLLPANVWECYKNIEVSKMLNEPQWMTAAFCADFLVPYHPLIHQASQKYGQNNFMKDYWQFLLNHQPYLAHILGNIPWSQILSALHLTLDDFLTMFLMPLMKMAYEFMPENINMIIDCIRKADLIFSAKCSATSGSFLEKFEKICCAAAEAN